MTRISQARLDRFREAYLTVRRECFAAEAAHANFSGRNLAEWDRLWTEAKEKRAALRRVLFKGP
jgi:hypothetical protein